MPRGAELARLCAFNAGIQIVWGAVLAVSLQSRTIELAPGLAPREFVASYAGLAAQGALVASIVQLAAGLLADRRRRSAGHRSEFFVAGVALALPALAWFYLAPTFVQLTFAFVLLQIGMNVAGGPYQAVIADYVVPKRRGMASSWMSAYQSFGNVAGLLIAGFVHDLRLVAVLLAAPLAGTAAISTLAARRLPPVPSEPTAPLRSLRSLGVLFFSRGLINVGFFTLLGFLFFFVNESLGVRGGAARTQTALLFITFTLAAIAGAVAAARPVDRYDKRLVVSVAIAVLAGALAVLAGAGGLALALGAALVAGIAWGAFVTADWALASTLLPGTAMAAAMGIWNIATTVPQIVAPLLTAPLVTRADAVALGSGPRQAIELALLEFVAGAILIWLLPRA